MRVIIYDPADNSTIAAGKLTNGSDGPHRHLVAGRARAHCRWDHDWWSPLFRHRGIRPGDANIHDGGIPAGAEDGACRCRTPSRRPRFDRRWCDGRCRPPLQTAVLFNPATATMSADTLSATQPSRSCDGNIAARRAGPRGRRQQRDEGARVSGNLQPPIHLASRLPRRRSTLLAGRVTQQGIPTR